MNDFFLRLKFYCPECNARMITCNDYISCQKCEYKLINKEGIYISDARYDQYQAFQEFHGTQLRERSNAEFSTSKYEYVVYKEFLKNALDLIGDSKTVLEVGAGDGRFTGILLENNYVIANDINFHSLKRFKETIGESENERILFICTSFDDMPIFSKQIDLVVAIESLLYANEHFRDILQNIIGNVKPNGYIIDSEPIKASAILYSLLNNDPLENILSLINGKKKEKLSNDIITDSKVFTKQELENIYLSTDLVIKKQSGTPELISIISLLLANGKLELSTAKNILDNHLHDYMDNYRCMISLLQVDEFGRGSDCV